jgi:hypothetical protein
VKNSKSQSDKPRCGLCGKTKNLVKTACCGEWICNDEHKYVMFSYATNSCSRNHRRYTLCGYHNAEGHEGAWQDCLECKEAFETEMYVYYGTNEFNFNKLQNPPSYKPTLCSGCGMEIKLGTDAYIRSDGKYWCQECGDQKMRIVKK